MIYWGEILNKKIRVHDYELSMRQGTKIDGRIIVKNIKNENMRCSIEIEPSNGTTTVQSNGYWSYTPDRDFIGIEEFKVEVFIPKIGIKYSTIKIDVQEKGETPRISRIIQLEDTFVIHNDDEDILKIDFIDLNVILHRKKIIKNKYSSRTMLNITGTIEYNIDYSVGIKHVKRTGYWGEESDEYDFVPDKELSIKKNRNFNTSIDLTDHIDDMKSIELGNEIKYHNYEILDSGELLLRHYCAVEIYIDNE